MWVVCGAVGVGGAGVGGFWAVCACWSMGAMECFNAEIQRYGENLNL